MSDIPFKQTSLSILEIWNHLSRGQMISAPYYQRDSVWKPKYQIDLMESIIQGFPISQMVLVEKENRCGYFILDGKQRTEAIQDFQANKFSISVPGFPSQKMTWHDITSPSGKMTVEELKRLRFIAAKFESYKIPIIEFQWMPFSKQRDMFSKINQSVQLGNNERIYCINFLTKNFLQFVWDQSLENYKVLQRQVGSKKRMAHLRYVHNILVMSFGNSLKEPVNEERSKNSQASTISTSAEMLEDLLLDSGVNETTEMSLELLKTLKLDTSIKIYLDVCRSLKGVFEMTTITKMWENTIIRDAIVFFIQKHGNNIYTTSEIRNHHAILHEMMTNYAIDISKKYGGDESNQSSPDIYRRATENGNTCKKRLDLLEEKFQEMCQKNGINTNTRNVTFTETERRKAMLFNAQINGGRCPLPHCGRSLTDSNCQIDHVHPKSKSGMLVPVAICKECNQKKSNWTGEELSHYLEYVEKYAVPE